MEQNPSQIVIPNNALTTLKGQDGFHPKKKKRSPMHVFRVAFYMLKSKKSKKLKAVDTISIWQKLFGIGSVRPLHIQADPKDPPKLIEGPAAAAPASVLTAPLLEHIEVFTPPMSPAQASVASSSSYGMSQYASATNLQELDEINESDEEDEDEDRVFNDKEADEMIDLKAEQFIAQFYQQMRIQNDAYDNRRNRKSY